MSVFVVLRRRQKKRQEVKRIFVVRFVFQRSLNPLHRFINLKNILLALQIEYEAFNFVKYLSKYGIDSSDVEIPYKIVGI